MQNENVCAHDPGSQAVIEVGVTLGFGMLRLFSRLDVRILRLGLRRFGTSAFTRAKATTRTSSIWPSEELGERRGGGSDGRADRLEDQDRRVIGLVSAAQPHLS